MHLDRPRTKYANVCTTTPALLTKRVGGVFFGFFPIKSVNFCTAPSLPHRIDKKGMAWDNYGVSRTNSSNLYAIVSLPLSLVRRAGDNYIFGSSRIKSANLCATPSSSFPPPISLKIIILRSTAVTRKRATSIKKLLE